MELFNLGSSSKDFRFVYRSIEPHHLDTRYYLVEIPKIELNWLPNVDVSIYSRHDHNNLSNSSRYRCISRIPVYLQDLSMLPLSSTVFVDNILHGLFLKVKDGSIRFMSLRLDGTVTYLPSPIYSNRKNPAILSLGGKIYLWGGFTSDNPGQYFGEVFDPATRTWSGLPQPPAIGPTIDSNFIVSLKSEGKFLVYDTRHPRFLMYEVTSRRWTTYQLDSVLSERLEPTFMHGDVVINEDDRCLYWLDNRHGSIFAFDLESVLLYSGPIVGLEHMSILRHLDQFARIFLVHLWSEFFCLIWTKSIWDDDAFIETETHFAFLRIVKSMDSLDNPLLTAFVVGCFMDSVRFAHSIIEVIRI